MILMFTFYSCNFEMFNRVLKINYLLSITRDSLRIIHVLFILYVIFFNLYDNSRLINVPMVHMGIISTSSIIFFSDRLNA